MPERLLVTGLALTTNGKALANYFEHYGRVVKSAIKIDPNTGESAGTGLIEYAEQESMDAVLAETDLLELDGMLLDVQEISRKEKKRKTDTKTKSVVKTIAKKVLKSRQEYEAIAASKFAPPPDDDKEVITCDRVFVGGLSKNTNSTTLSAYFSYYGAVKKVVIKKDAVTGNHRGFGYVAFADYTDARKAAREVEPHVIDGKTVEVKEYEKAVRPNMDKEIASEEYFVGGLPQTATNEKMEEYFSYYGDVKLAKAVCDRETGLCRGFGFLQYFDVKSAEKCLAEVHHEIDGKKFDVKMGQKPTRDNQKIFVGGLLKMTTNETLAEYFSHYGEVLAANVKIDLETGMSRGFAFVEMATPASVDLAVNELLGHVIEDKEVTVRKFTRDQACEKLFVGGLKPTTTSEMLSDYFELFGTVAVVEMKMDNENRPFAILQFEDQRAAQLVLDEPCHIVDKKGLDVKLYETAQKKKRNEDEADVASKIFIGGLSPKSTQNSVSLYFTHYGDVKKVDVKAGRGWGVVQFLQPESAELAVAEEVNHVIDGKVVDVRVYKAKGPKGSHQGNNQAVQKCPVAVAPEVEEAEVVVEEDKEVHAASVPVDDSDDW